MMSVYITDPSTVAAPVWSQVGNVWMPRIPLGDTSLPGFARLGYAATVEYLSSIGARLPKRHELRALQAVSYVLKPVCLPDVSQQRVAGIFRNNYASEDDYQAATQALRVRMMQSREWALYHDAQVAAQVEALKSLPDFDPTRPVFGIGKHWVEAEDGEIAPWHTAYLAGWPNADGTWIQSGSNADSHGRGQHDDRYADYSSTLLCVRDDAP